MGGGSKDREPRTRDCLAQIRKENKRDDLSTWTGFGNHIIYLRISYKYIHNGLYTFIILSYIHVYHIIYLYIL